MFLLLVASCLLDRDLYEARRVALTDHDADGFVREDDCDDADSSVSPGAPEICDDLDNDCDGTVDQGAVDATVWYLDADADGYGDASDEGTPDCGAVPGAVSDHTDCDDAEVGIHPAATEVPYDGVDDDCDGSDVIDVDGDGFPAVIAGGDDCDDADPTILPGAEETWANGFTDNDCDGEIEAIVHEFGGVAWSGWAEGDWLGRRTVALGDLDGDSLADVGIGSEYDSTMGYGSGALYAVDGEAGGELPRDRALYPNTAGAYFGSDMDGGQDATGDEIPDLLITDVEGAGGVGSAWLIDGAAWNAVGTAYADDVAVGVVEGSGIGTYGPTSVRFVGDVNGDGITDIALGECCGDAAGPNTAGRVGIVSSDRFTGTIEDADVIIDGPWEETYVGGNIDAIGDQNGDGLPDIVVGGASGLAAAVVGGTTSGNLADIATTLVYGEVSWGYATSRNAGDLDGDGHEDIVVLGDDANGRVYIFTHLDSSPIRGIEVPSCTFAWSETGSVRDIIPLGDLDGDGRSELFLSKFFSDIGGQRAWILPGLEVQFEGLVDAESTTLQGVSVVYDALFGYSASLVGDVDGDGAPDLVLGGPDYSASAVRAGGATLITIPR